MKTVPAKSEFRKIPKAVKGMYDIEVGETCMYIHKPNFIYIPFDSGFSISVEEGWTKIRSKYSAVQLFNSILSTHITIF